jgi:adenylate kinase
LNSRCFDIFASDSVFCISEAEFAKLPQDQRLHIQQKAMKSAKDIKSFSKFMVEQAKQEGQYETSRNVLIACGRRLSNDDQLALMQLIGKAIAEYTEKELPVW